MKLLRAACIIALMNLAAMRVDDQTTAADSQSAAGSSTKKITDSSQRGKLHDAAQPIRGDLGRWQDEERWLAAPTPLQESKRTWLDDWLDLRSTEPFTPTDADDVWLLFSTRQLNDNDRVWVESVERRGNRITVVVTQATWRGKYFKNFTQYFVFGINAGKLEPGTYEATCVLSPSTFTQFTGDGRPQSTVDNRQVDNWPKDDRPAETKPIPFTTKFTVVKAVPE